MLRIICLISVALLLLSTAVSGGDVPEEDNVRVPRALVLKPVVKVKTHHDDDEGPFDFIADWISKFVNLRKQTTPTPLRLLVPGVSGINDELYIEHMTQSPHTKSSFVIIRLSDPKSPAYGMGGMGPTTTFHPKPIFPSGSTRIMPKPSGNFFPASPTVPTWSRPSPIMNMPFTSNHFNNMHYGNQGYDYNHMNYGQFNQRNHPNYRNLMPMKFGPNGHNFKPPFNPYLHQSYRSHDRFPQNPYGTYDRHNSIPGASGGGFHHGMESFKPTNYPGYSSFPGNHHNNHSNLHTMGSEQVKVTLEHVDIPISSTTSSTVSDHNKLDEANHLDRMISTVSHLANYSRKPVKLSTRTTTESLDPDTDFKYSSQDIQEISPPNLLQTWKKFVVKNEDNHVMKINKDAEPDVGEKVTEKSRRAVQDNTNENNLMKTRISEIIKKRNRKTTPSRRVLPTTPIVPSYSRDFNISDDILLNRVTEKIESNSSDLIDKPSNIYKIENITLRSIENVMNLTASASWKNRNNRRPDKLLERLKSNGNNRKVRIVESVKSSVSMVKSKAKPK